MLNKVEVNLKKIDWDCLQLLSQKEKIPVSDLIGRMIANSLEEYEDFQDAIDIEICKRESKGKKSYTHEEFWKLANTI